MPLVECNANFICSWANCTHPCKSSNSSSFLICSFSDKVNQIAKLQIANYHCNMTCNSFIGFTQYPANIHLFKVNNRNTRKRCEICSKLTIKTPERRSGVFIVNFEEVSWAETFMKFFLSKPY